MFRDSLVHAVVVLGHKWHMCKSVRPFEWLRQILQKIIVWVIFTSKDCEVRGLRFEVLTAVLLKIQVLQRKFISLGELSRRFGGFRVKRWKYKDCSSLEIKTL